MNKDVKKEDLKGELRVIADLIGAENAIVLADYYKGTSVFFPRGWHFDYASRIIAEKWDGSNTKQLARELDVSETYVRDTVNRKRSAVIQTKLDDMF